MEPLESTSEEKSSGSDSMVEQIYYWISVGQSFKSLIVQVSTGVVFLLFSFGIKREENI